MTQTLLCTVCLLFLQAGRAGNTRSDDNLADCPLVFPFNGRYSGAVPKNPEKGARNHLARSRIDGIEAPELGDKACAERGYMANTSCCGEQDFYSAAAIAPSFRGEEGDQCDTQLTNSPSLSLDIIHEISDLMSDEEYLYVALVCKAWKNSWRASRVTRGVTRHTTPKLLAYSFECGLKRTVGVCSAAARLGKLDLLQFAHTAGGCSWDSETCSKAAEGGHLPVLRWARKYSCPWDVKTCSKAASRGQLGVLQWARNHGCPCANEKVCFVAARGGHMNVLLWVCSAFPWYLTASSVVCDGAAAGGQFAVLKWARAWGCPWNAATATDAAEGGHLELLMWMREHNCPWDETTCAGAARGGHLNIIKWARANGCLWDKATCVEAVKRGYLHILTWARANGCPWDGRAYASAALEGQLHVLTWAQANGCPREGEVGNVAADSE